MAAMAAVCVIFFLAAALGDAALVEHTFLVWKRAPLSSYILA
jgi:hypothetical protein